VPDLVLDVRLDGHDEPVGKLVRDEKGAIAFAYEHGFLKHPRAHGVSLSLPLTDEPFGDVPTRAFFENLLQERDDQLLRVKAREGLAHDDIVGLLFHLGADCPGAISVLPQGAPPAKIPGDLEADYTPLSDEQLVDVVNALHRGQRLPDERRDPSPLAGVRGKIALTLLPDGRFAEPRGGAPTTHILKVPDRDRPQEVRFERAAMTLSRRFQLETAQVEHRVIGNIDALLITRFDRSRDQQGRIIRIHQEDFAQALGLPRALKYQRDGSGRRRFDADAISWVLDQTRRPVVSRYTFIAATLFDLLVGNTDAHAKNLGLLYLSPTPVLAPRYDVLPTRLDRSVTDKLSCHIGGAQRLEDITTEDMKRFLAALGILLPAPQRRLLSRIGSDFIRFLVSELPAIDQAHGRTWGDLIASNIRHLAPVLGVEIPDAVKDRDAFVRGRAGGWAFS